MEISSASRIALPAVLAATLWTGSSASGQNFEPPASQSAEIAWASDAFATNLMADGVTTFGESGLSIFFELGTFQQGFDPRATPPDQWASHWIVLQSSPYDTGDDQVINTATLSSNSASFGIGQQAYIWGFTSRETGEDAEWILMAAQEWKWPSTEVLMPATFSVSDVNLASEVIVGSVNGMVEDRPYHMMFEGVSVIPEPSVAAFAACVSIGFAFRRRRSAAAG